jgi:predicted Kef-type K+ transport protein
MDPIWLAATFAFGLLVKLIRIPPLVGYLIAGFVLNYYFNAQSGEFIDQVSDLGVSLLLFIIGLKLKLKTLFRKEIWAGATLHMASTVVVYALLILTLSFTSLALFTEIDFKMSLLLAFALSFSSTVFAVKVLEENDELSSMQGVVSIGVLIMQDIFAVLFIVFATGKIPNLYAIGLPFLLLAIRPLLFYVFKKVGRGELLVLYGFFLALVVGAALFEFVGLKADLGALIIGILVSNHPRSKELSEKLSEFKDFFLIGFFLSIGLSGLPTKEIFFVSLILALAINLKVILYFFVFTQFKLRARTAVFTSLTLANYSEFGLIVAVFAASTGLIPQDWIVVLALSLAITFLVSSVLNNYTHKIYFGIKHWIHIFERKNRLSYDLAMDIGNAEILIIGMGKLGQSTYKRLYEKYGQVVLGIDYKADLIKKLKAEGKNVSHEDATDGEFWDLIAQNPERKDQVKMVLLCMDSHKSNTFALQKLQKIDFKGQIAAIVRYEDEKTELLSKGADFVYNYYSEAGFGFADHVCNNIDGDLCSINP